MVENLVAEARNEAERASPDVRAAALLRISRVLTAFDQDEARRTFQRGVQAISTIPSPNGEFLLAQASLIAAAVAPDLIAGIRVADRFPPSFRENQLCHIMLEHGHVDAATEYVLQQSESGAYPFRILPTLVQKIPDEATRLRVFRRAAEAWRTSRDDGFIHTFAYHWQVLPAEEATELVREIVRSAKERPDQQIDATLDPEGTIQLSSGRQFCIFRLLHVLRRLDPALAESLVEGHAQLKAAAARFPNGMDSVQEEAQARRASCGGGGGGYCMAGSPRDFAYTEAVMRAQRDGEFGPAMEHALTRYADDGAPHRPNAAPKEFWPSAAAFRVVLYRAGQRLGPNALVYLERIPDEDLRLLAKIELSAALAQLPAFPDTQRGYHA